MSEGVYVLLSCILSFGVPMALAVHSLMTLEPSRPGPDGPKARGVHGPAPLPSDDEPDLPPLPASLIPKLQPAPGPAQPVRERVLEDA